MATSRARRWLPVLVWAAVIFGLSSVPSLGTGLGAWDEAMRTLAHAGEYAVLGALLARAAGVAWVPLLLGALYAASDELHQSFVPGRVASVTDVAVDVVGLSLGVAAWRVLSSRRALA